MGIKKAEYWFKAKKNGFGWVPAREGWMALVVYLGFVAASFLGVDFEPRALKEIFFSELVPSIGFPTLVFLVVFLLKAEPIWQGRSARKK